ncbi:MAG: class I SAM-dependent methyltransferase [Candidatus Coatesbacteria bacterium]|nr:class I SAM-dependent methyltransferase [Candidatus Coatesbacteria bacterium]
MALKHSREQTDLLTEINQDLPKDVDWKRGAMEYMGQQIEEQGASAERYHLIKPFEGGPKFDHFYVNMHKLPNLLEKLDLPMRSSFLDVACGPGWLSHYLGKLGHTVLGFDISDKMIEIAKRRMAADPFPPYPEAPFDVSFFVHDIEDAPLSVETLFDAAVLESCLHHFYDPVAALENVARNLKPEGLIAIIEGVAPEACSCCRKDDLEIMDKYRTLERPYTKKQMIRLLRLTGFEYHEFYYPINGFFAQTPEAANSVKDRILNGREWNLIIASKSLERMKQLSETFARFCETGDKFRYAQGFYGEETGPEGLKFRWSGAESSITISNVDEMEFVIESHLPRIAGRQQEVFIYIDNVLSERLALSTQQEAVTVLLNRLIDNSRIDFLSDSVFSPRWYGEEDERMLSFMLRVVSVK